MKKLAVSLFLFAQAALAQQDPVLALREASRAIDAANATLAAVDPQTDGLAALTEAIRGLEGGLASLRVALKASKAQEIAKQQALMGNRAELGRLLATLISLQNSQSTAVVLHPEGATASARAGLLLTELTPELRDEARNIRGELAALNALNALHDAAQANMQTALENLQEARNRLTVALREEQPQPETLIAPESLERLATSSQDLNTLANTLKENFPELALPAQPPAQPGQLPLPVNGSILRHFNEANEAGIQQPGIVIAASPLSLVTAPQAGIVRFAGEFLEYGQVVILEPGPNELQIYAGLGQVYVKAGEVLESGAAMGLLGGEMPDSAEFLAEGGENDKGLESLYIEIRENGMPVDPETRFTAN